MPRFDVFLFFLSCLFFAIFAYQLTGTGISINTPFLFAFCFLAWPISTIILVFVEPRNRPLTKLRHADGIEFLLGWLVFFYRLVLPIFWIWYVLSIMVSERVGKIDFPATYPIASALIENGLELENWSVFVDFSVVHIGLLFAFTCVAPIYVLNRKIVRNQIEGAGHNSKSLSLFPYFDPTDSGKIRLDLLASIPQKRLFTVYSLKDRAMGLRHRATVLLCIMVALIVSGVVISIFFAGDIVSGEVRPDNRLTQLRGYVRDTNAEIVTLNEDVTNLRERRASILSALTRDGKEFTEGRSEIVLNGNTITFPATVVIFSDDECRRKDKEGKLVDAKCAELEVVQKNISYLAETEAALEAVLRLRNSQQIILDQVSNELGTNFPKYLPTLSNDIPKSDKNLLIASAVTRFGILFVVIYLVQIIVSIYRYSLRLASHYDHLADCLSLTASTSNSLGNWRQDLLPDIRFSKDPKSPSAFVSKLTDKFLSSEKENKVTPIAKSDGNG